MKMGKKESVIGTRVSDKLMEDIIEYSEKKNIKISKLIREALKYYLLFKLEHEKRNIPTIIISKAEYSTLLECLSEQNLKKLANVCFEKALQGFNYIVKKESGEHQIQVNIQIFLKNLVEFVFSEKNQNWFKSIHTNFQGNKLIIAGVHDLNVNFSIFMKYYLERIVSLYSYRLVKENLLENKLILEFLK